MFPHGQFFFQIYQAILRAEGKDLLNKIKKNWGWADEVNERRLSASSFAMITIYETRLTKGIAH